MTEIDTIKIFNDVLEGDPEFAIIVLTEVHRVASFFGKLIPTLRVSVPPSSLKMMKVNFERLVQVDFQYCHG